MNWRSLIARPRRENSTRWSTCAGKKKSWKNQKRADQEADRASTQQWSEMVRLANVVLPVGWLPLGVMAGAEGRVVPAILGLLGMTAIGSASLWRAYRTTLGLYSGQSSNVKGRAGTAPTMAVALPGRSRQSRALLVEARIPGLSEPVSAIALGGFRSLVRSPEAKMMLLSPLIMIPIFGSMLWRGRAGIPEVLRPLVAIGGMVLRALRRDPVDGQSIRLRPRRLSRVHPVAGVAAGHSAGEEPGLRPAGFGIRRDLAHARAGFLSVGSRSLPGDASRTLCRCICCFAYSRT